MVVDTLFVISNLLVANIYLQLYIFLINEPIMLYYVIMSGRWDSNPPLAAGDGPQALKACVLTTTPLPLIIFKQILYSNLNKNLLKLC